jgi:hypothetical protein
VGGRVRELVNHFRVTYDVTRSLGVVVSALSFNVWRCRFTWNIETAYFLLLEPRNFKLQGKTGERQITKPYIHSPSSVTNLFLLNKCFYIFRPFPKCHHQALNAVHKTNTCMQRNCAACRCLFVSRTLHVKG